MVLELELRRLPLAAALLRLGRMVLHFLQALPDQLDSLTVQLERKTLDRMPHWQRLLEQWVPNSVERPMRPYQDRSYHHVQLQRSLLLLFRWLRRLDLMPNKMVQPLAQEHHCMKLRVELSLGDSLDQEDEAGKTQLRRDSAWVAWVERMGEHQPQLLAELQAPVVQLLEGLVIAPLVGQRSLRLPRRPLRCHPLGHHIRHSWPDLALLSHSPPRHRRSHRPLVE